MNQIDDMIAETNKWLDTQDEAKITLGDLKRWVKARWPDASDQDHRRVVMAVVA